MEIKNISDERDNYHFFWDRKSVFSQWYYSPFTDMDGQVYVTAEQYMMAEKAKLFKDYTIMEMIIKTHDPKQCKMLGRKVIGFNEKIWIKNREKIVYKACIFKFSQNEKLKKKLLETGDKCIVEASPYDKIWGIGMKESHKDATNPLKWKGLNLLGNALMMARHGL
jgi:ribA/ribD-fused uncharacterized protein